MKELIRSLRRIGVSLLDFCLPRRCAGCEGVRLLSHEGYWCKVCLEQLPWIGHPLCSCCGRPFPDSPSSPDHLCGECLAGAFHFDSARSAVLHSGTVRNRIHQFKFAGRLHWVAPLADLLVATFQKEAMEDVDLIVPVPLHVKRLRSRGFNQAALLAKIASRRLQIPTHFDVLIRKHWTEPQTRLSRKDRLENVKGAFDVPLPDAVQGRSILLIDDVFTTGTTINECVRALKSAGASRVHAVTVARALPELKPAILD